MTQYREVPKNSIPQRVKKLKKFLIFVGLAQELPQSHLQYTDDPLHNTVINHSTVKCPKNSVPQKHKTFKGSYCWACSGITSKPPAVYRRPIFNPKSPFLKVRLS